MNTKRTIFPTAAAALTVGFLLGGGVAIAATGPAPAPGAPSECSAVTLANEQHIADRLERAIDACLEATRGTAATLIPRSDVQSCRLREITSRPWTADTIERRLAACSTAAR